jgi:glutamate-1-semialdehyde 2,1-aminomutase
MEWIAPQGPVYQAGTLSGNPLAMSAGLATLEILSQAGVWESLQAATSQLVDGLRSLAQTAGVDVQVNQAGTMFTVFFTADPVINWTSAKHADLQQFARFYQQMLPRGVYLAPSQFEACFVSAAHQAPQIELTLAAAQAAFQAI